MALCSYFTFQLLPSHFFSPSLSPSPAHVLTTPSIIQIRKPLSTHLTSHEIAISGSPFIAQSQNHGNPETEIPPNTKKRKKKKLRPSFYDITRERWSLKIASNRTQFPWQEKPQLLESSPNILISSVPIDFSEEKTQNLSHGTDSLSFPLQTRAISAPWAHGAKRGKSHLNSEVRNLVLANETGDSCIDGVEAVDLEVHGKGEESPFRRKQVREANLNSEVEKVHGEGAKPPKGDKGMGANLNSVVKHEVAVQRMEGEKAKSREVCPEVEKSTVGTIVEKLKNCGREGHYHEKEQNSESSGSGCDFPNSSGKDPKNVGGKIDICNFQWPHQEERMSSSNVSSGNLIGLNGNSIQLPWEAEEGPNGERWRKSNTELAEKTIPETELRRLRSISLRMKERMKVGAAGVTKAVVGEILNKWKEEEMVKIKFEGPPSLNMKRTHEILERRTGGLVIWRCGSSLVLYRGMAYKLPCVQSYVEHPQTSCSTHSDVFTVDVRVMGPSNAGSGTVFEHVGDESTDINYINKLLDELGPRFEDWSGYDPIPVDADLLPGVVPEYKPPFRLLPYGKRSCVHDRQMTSLRRLARRVPPHFALGRNRQHQGLAKAMVKLWEKSAIAKIAIKRGVPNTCNERMAEELKKLTGGTLISRNKDYIVFFRGNDFLSPAMKETLVERQELAMIQQDEEEQARLKASPLIAANAKTSNRPFVAGTLAETLAADSRWGNQPSNEDRAKLMRDATLAKHASLVRYLELKLAHAKKKLKKAEKALCKVQEHLEPADLPTDLETITDEERFLFRKVGLSMKPVILLGRRGIFDGTIENMHLHWKYKELVKIIVKGKSFQLVKHIAISLEAESGGVLISLDKTTKGYAIVVYRGKNYHCPQALRPKNLLTRRQALARSIELQRREALNHHISDLQERIELLKSELAKMETFEEVGSEALYSRVVDACFSDGDVEDEGEEAYLETYISSDEYKDEDGQNQIDKLMNEIEPI